MHAPRLALALALAGCGSTAPYVWIDDLPRTVPIEASSGDYVIGAGDVLTVRVYNQDAVTTRGRVRPDGRIAVPLVGDMEALGRRPVDLAREIEAKLKPFFVAPAVSIGVDEVQPARISVLGEVSKPGVVQLDPRAGVLDAIAAAGGLTEYADRDRIFVVRRQASTSPLRIRFTYARLVGQRRAAAFALSTGDVVTVE